MSDLANERSAEALRDAQEAEQTAMDTYVDTYVKDALKDLYDLEVMFERHPREFAKVFVRYVGNVMTEEMTYLLEEEAKECYINKFR